MNVNEHKLTKEIVGAAYEVSNHLGCGFLEKVYERALARELAERGIKSRTQVSFPVMYKRHLVGKYCADMVVEDKLAIELKCVQQFSDEHLAQCINYLTASGLAGALLINFQHPKVDWRYVHPRSLTAVR